MGSFKYSSDGVTETLTIVTDNGDVLSFDNNHPKFQEVKTKVVSNQDFDGVEDMLNPGKAIVAEFAKLSTELSIRGSNLYLEGELLQGVLADKIVSVFEAGEDYVPFVAFLEKLHTNPNPHSVENLYRWLQASDFVIADDGDIIGYKGVRNDFTSVHSGSVIRNGALFDGHVENRPGDVIEMDRATVTFDPSQGCSYGLHVGTWEYASTWSEKVVKVKVNPKYVVSVPTDCSDQKMRVCRYEIIEETSTPVGAAYDRGYVQQTYETLDDDLYEDNYYDYGDEPDYDEEETDPDYSQLKFSNLRDYPGMNGIPATFDPATGTVQIDTRYVKADTRLNHTHQQRDSRGRFIKKGN